jgi:hypothetical protein
MIDLSRSFRRYAADQLPPLVRPTPVRDEVFQSASRDQTEHASSDAQLRAREQALAMREAAISAREVEVTGRERRLLEAEGAIARLPQWQQPDSEKSRDQIAREALQALRERQKPLEAARLERDQASKALADEIIAVGRKFNSRVLLSEE